MNRRSGLLLICCMLLLSGCSTLDGSSTDSGHLLIRHDKSCDVSLLQRALVDSNDDKVVETVTLTPDCEVTVKLRSSVGDDAMMDRRDR